MRTFVLNSFLLFLIVFLVQCNDEESIIDEMAPEIILLSNINDSTVWNNVSIILDFTDREKVDTVEIFVNGTLLSKLTSPPYEFNWDTRTVEDGLHTIKINASNQAGQSSSKEFNVNVLNTLLTIKSNNFFGQIDNYKMYAFLSDQSGKTIAINELVADETIIFRPDGYESKDFTLGLAFIDSSIGFVNTYANVSRGTVYELPGNYGIKKCSITYESTPSTLSYYLFSDGQTTIASEYFEDVPQEGNLSFDVNPSPLAYLLVKSGGMYKYSIIENIESDKDYIVDCNTMITPTHKELTFPFEISGVEIIGIKEKTQISTFFASSQKSTTVDIYYPESYFDNYLTIYNTPEVNGQRDSYCFKNSTPTAGNVTPNTFQIEVVNNSIDNFQYAMSGNGDWVRFYWGGENSGFMVAWSHNVPLEVVIMLCLNYQQRYPINIQN